MPNDIIFTGHGMLRIYQRAHKMTHSEAKKFILSLINKALIIYQDTENTCVFIGKSFKIVIADNIRLVTFVVRF